MRSEMMGLIVFLNVSVRAYLVVPSVTTKCSYPHPFPARAIVYRHPMFLLTAQGIFEIHSLLYTLQISHSDGDYQLMRVKSSRFSA
jgi:hypothetical protein